MSDNRSSFFSLLEQRLAEGAKTYGFAEQPGGDPRPLLELYGELQQELVDIAGWGKLAFDKIKAMEAKLRAAELAAPSESAVIANLKRERDQLLLELVEAKGMVKFWNDLNDRMHAKVAELEAEVAYQKAESTYQRERLNQACKERDAEIAMASKAISDRDKAAKRNQELTAVIGTLEATVHATDARNRELEVKLAAIKADTKQWLEKL